MLAEGRTGLISAGDGSVNPIRLNSVGALVVSREGGQCTENAMLSKIFVCSTAVGGVAPGTALSTTPPIALFNPLSSGVELSVLKTSTGYVSGTLGAGSILYAYYTPQTTVPTGGAELVPVCSRLGSVKGVGRVFQGSTLAGTPLILRAAFNLGAALATTAVGLSNCQDAVDGAYIVSPGSCFIMQGVTAAGSTPLVTLAVMWEEISI